MLYVFYGSDDKKARARLNGTLEALKKRAPEAAVTRVGEEEIEAVRMDDLLAIQGLFYSKRIVIFDKALSDKGKRGAVLERLGEMKDSDHVFLVIEHFIDTDLEKKLTKHASKIELCGDAKKPKFDDAADWTITNALECGDGRAIWIALQKTMVTDPDPRMYLPIHGQLFWKAKQLVLERRFGKRGEAATKALVSELTELPHEARRRGVDLDFALELFALKMGK